MDLISFVKGLCSEKEKVLSALDAKQYEAAGIALGFEDLEAIRRRAEIPGDPQPSELDDVYSFLLKDIGPVDMPDPATVCLVDECGKRNIPVNPLDMNDEMFSEIYCNSVSTFEFLRENRVVKKALKTKFDKSSPEAFVDQWDNLMKTLKGNQKVNEARELYMAEQIKDICKYRSTLIVLVERERVNGLLSHLGVGDGLR